MVSKISTASTTKHSNWDSLKPLNRLPSITEVRRPGTPYLEELECGIKKTTVPEVIGVKIMDRHNSDPWSDSLRKRQVCRLTDSAEYQRGMRALQGAASYLMRKRKAASGRLATVESDCH